MRGSGKTLIELLVAVSIISILTVPLGFKYAGWIGGYRVESQIRELYSDLMDVRLRAKVRKRAHFIVLEQTQYKIHEDIYPWPDGDLCLNDSDNHRPPGYNDPIPLVKKKLAPHLPLTWNNIRVPIIKINRRGLSNTNRTICVNTNYNADYDCISISMTRIRLGKLKKKIPDGGSCNSTNCIKK